jgi:hypothetical protein
MSDTSPAPEYSYRWFTVYEKKMNTKKKTSFLLYQHRVIMMEKSVEWLAGETEVLGENLP